MPANIIKINNSDELKWYVGDSKMEELIKLLNKLGSKIKYERQNIKRRHIVKTKEAIIFLNKYYCLDPDNIKEIIKLLKEGEVYKRMFKRGRGL